MKKLYALIGLVAVCLCICFASNAGGSINSVNISVTGDNYDDCIDIQADGNNYSLSDYYIYPEEQEIHIILSADDGYYFRITKASNIHLTGCKYKSAERQNSAKELYVVVQLNDVVGRLESETSSTRGWKQGDNGWWWDNGDGTYPVSSWKWLDDNADGRYECYYFDPNGYCLISTTTPDGYTVNAQGQWISNGAIMYRTSENGTTMYDANTTTQNASQKKSSGNSSYSSSNNSTKNTGTSKTYVLNTRSGKFHYTWCESVTKMSSWNKQVVTCPRSNVIAAGYVPCKNCNP